MATKMSKSNLKDYVNSTNDIILVGSALIAIVVTLLDFFGVLSNIKWLSERIPIFILLGISFLLVNVVVERRTYISKIQQTLDNIISTSVFGAQYLEDAVAVVSQIERAVRNAEENIMAVGAKSRAVNYLNAIEDNVLTKRTSYYRLLDGEYITHELHEHLKKLFPISNVHIGWTPREKFGNLVVTDKECILVFPGTNIERFSGLWLPGQTNSRRYNHYFLESFSKCLPIRTEKAIEVLCIKCNPDIAGDSTKISQVLEKELKESLTKSSIIVADNNI